MKKAMLSRLMIALVALVVVVMAPMHVSARSCILSNAASQKTCQRDCCANQTCCETSFSNTASPTQPLAKTTVALELSATYAPAVTAIVSNQASADQRFAYVRASSCARPPSRLVLLCTFLI